jgi:SNF2 family DNA or RNA helicase
MKGKVPMPNSNYLKKTHDWQRLFDQSVLAKAKELLNYQNKDNLESMDDHHCMAHIYDPESGFRAVNCYYPPASYTDKWENAVFRCDCHRRISYYGIKYCSHMAAMLYLWEKAHGPWEFTETAKEHNERIAAELRDEEIQRRKLQKEAESGIPASFSEIFTPEADDVEPPYFDLRQILKFTHTNRYVINMARLILDKEGVSALTCNLDFDRNGNSQIRTSATVDDGLNTYRTEANLTAEDFSSYYCGCFKRVNFSFNYFSKSTTPVCEHLAALFVKLDDYLRLNNPGDVTNLALTRFLESFEDASDAQETALDAPADERPKRITVEPLLSIDNNSISLAYRAGRQGERLYVLRNLRDFVEAYESRTSIALSKKSSIDFSAEDITEASEKWLTNIRRKINEVASINNKLQAKSPWGYVSTLSFKSRETLGGSDLDNFYSLTEDSFVSCKSNGTNSVSQVKVGHTPLRMRLTSSTIYNKAGKPVGMDLTGTFPIILEGNIGDYVFSENHISRLSPEEKNLILPFAKAVDPDGRINLRVGKKDLPEFFYRALPRITQNPCIVYEDRTDGAMGNIIPPEGEYSFRLDREGDEIHCLATADYDGKVYKIGIQDAAADGYRDLRQEERIENILECYFWHNPDTGIYQMPTDDDTIYELLTEAVPALSRYGEVRGDSSFRTDQLRPVPSFTVGVSVDSDLMDISVISNDMSHEELLELFESYRFKKKYHKLRNGDFISFEHTESFKELETLSDDLGLDVNDILEGDTRLPVYRALYLDKILEEHDALASNRSRAFRSLVKNFSTIKDSDYEVPEGLDNVLRKYQKYGYKWLRTLYHASFGGILSDEMGLGKTVQVIAVIEALQNEASSGFTGPVLIVCPASLVYNWQEEFSRFAPDVRTAVIAGGIGSRRACFEELKKTDGQDRPSVYITSYDLLRRDALHYKDIRFDLMVIDEAQYIKNSKAVQTKAVKSIKASHRFALTGTPIENKLSELWSIFDFLMPGFLYTYNDFLGRFETPITKDKDEAVTARLKQMVSPFILRRLKTDVLKDLPEKLEEVRYARLEGEQRKLYDGQVVRMKHLIKDDNLGGAGRDKIQILAELTRIRQICCDPSLVFDGYEGGSAKLEACMELIESAMDGGHRMLLFSQFKSMLHIIEGSLKERGIAYYMITGETSKEKRMSLVHEFNEGDVPVFLISLKAGGTGLNLTGADVVIHYDPWWNLAVQNQATDRAHRIGQKNKVTAYKLISKDTIEEKILNLQEAKKDLADAILSGEQSSLMSLSPQELLGLLE